MRELAKSTLRLPWALWMVGVQQTSNLINPEGGIGRAAGALDALSQTAEQQLGEALAHWYRAGDHFQNGFVDTLFDLAAPPDWRPSEAIKTARQALDRSWSSLRAGLQSTRAR